MKELEKKIEFQVLQKLVIIDAISQTLFQRP